MSCTLIDKDHLLQKLFQNSQKLLTVFICKGYSLIILYLHLCRCPSSPPNIERKLCDGKLKGFEIRGPWSQGYHTLDPASGTAFNFSASFFK